MAARRASSPTPQSVPHLNDPLQNLGTSFTLKAREVYGLRGLLPPVVESAQQQMHRVMLQLRRPGSTPLEKYIALANLCNTNRTLFYQVLVAHLEELMPIVYTPTVGAACTSFHTIYTAPLGLYLSGYDDRGRFLKLLHNCPLPDVRIIVVTDGGRILGLGDLGTNGMGISIGKVALYVAGGGFAPSNSLPVVLDCGTNRAELLGSDLYMGSRSKRIQGEAHLQIMEEFCSAVSTKWPRCLIQFEDFQTDAAFAILERMRHRYLCFNDDIQGTGAIVLAGLINGLKAQGTRMAEARIVFYGAGSSACGVASMIVQLLESQGLSQERALSAVYMVDTKGLITNTRAGKLPPHKVPFARCDGTSDMKDLQEIISFVRPHALIGLAGAGPAWSQAHIEKLCESCDRPLIFPLSNPTSQAEVSAEQAYSWSGGQCIFASGSPFDPVTINGVTHSPGQCNNVFIFPGLGFGAAAVEAKTVADQFLLAAAHAVADEVSPDMLAAGTIYPELKNLRAVSLAVATRVAETAYTLGLAKAQRPADLAAYLRDQMWDPFEGLEAARASAGVSSKL